MQNVQRRSGLSTQTRLNWLLDASVFLGALVAILSGIYFLFLPIGGFQGGRNPTYGINILFARHDWDIIHTWGGVFMIVAVLLHVVYHWSWVTMMARKLAAMLSRRGSGLSKGARVNILVDAVIAISFLLAAISGVVFLFTPSAKAVDAGFLFSRATWEVIHTWSGVALPMAAGIHLAIHWRWVVNVTGRMFGHAPATAGRTRPATTSS